MPDYVGGIVLAAMIVLLAAGIFLVGIMESNWPELRRLWKRSVRDYFMPLTFWRTRQIKSDAFEAIHASASALYRIGSISKATMRKFDKTCLVDTDMKESQGSDKQNSR